MRSRRARCTYELSGSHSLPSSCSRWRSPAAARRTEPRTPASTQPATVTETVIETQTVPEEPEVKCSTAGLRLTLPEQELPPEVADVRERIFGAAVACDYETLEQIALEKGEGFTFSYGSGDFGCRRTGGSVEEAGTERPLPMLALAHDPDDAVHAQRVRLVRLADRVQRERRPRRLGRCSWTPGSTRRSRSTR